MKHSFTKLTFAAALVAVGALSVTTTFGAEFTAKIGHLESAQQTRNIMLEKVAALVSERTGGAVEFQIFPQGQLGQQREMTEGVQLGSLEATVAPAAFLGGFNPAVSILDIPFLLPNSDEKAQELRGGPFGDALCASFESRGVHCVGLWPNGRKNFTSNKPLDNIADFAGQKFRVMDSNILMAQFNSVGASAVALPFGELYTALQTGVVDGEENPLDTIRAMKFYEVQKHVIVSNHGAMEDVILFNPQWWAKLPANYQKIITDTFKEVIPELIAKKAASVASALTEIKASSANVQEISDAERAALKDKMFPAAVKAYIDRAGDEGTKLLDVYKKEMAAIGQ